MYRLDKKHKNCSNGGVQAQMMQRALQKMETQIFQVQTFRFHRGLVAVI